MEENPLERVTTLTFDLFGTVLDLAGSLAPAVDTLLAAGSASIGGGSFWDQWRARQRIEQYQDTPPHIGAQRLPGDLPSGPRLLSAPEQNRVQRVRCGRDDGGLA